MNPGKQRLYSVCVCFMIATVVCVCVQPRSTEYVSVQVCVFTAAVHLLLANQA